MSPFVVGSKVREYKPGISRPDCRLRKPRPDTSIMTRPPSPPMDTGTAGIGGGQHEQLQGWLWQAPEGDPVQEGKVRQSPRTPQGEPQSRYRSHGGARRNYYGSRGWAPAQGE